MCMVLTMLDKKDRREAVMETWGKKCTHLVFFMAGSEAVSEVQLTKNTRLVSLPTPQFYGNLWKVTQLALQYIFQKYYDSFDWLIKCDDDTYVIMENLRVFVYKTNESSPYFYGMEVLMPSTGEHFISGGSGYIMSHRNLEKLVQAFELPTCETKRIASEDYEIARCFHQVCAPYKICLGFLQYLHFSN